MRINCYEFPETVSANERFQNGADNKRGHCVLNREDCEDCPYNSNGWQACDQFVCDEAGYIVKGISITKAKKLLRTFTGYAWTEHCERDGTVFETSDITLYGNNSKYKYNHHL